MSSVGGQTRDQEDWGAKREREGEMAWQVKEGGTGRVNEAAAGGGGVCSRLSCVSVADLLVWKQIFSLSDSINLPHLS